MNKKTYVSCYYLAVSVLLTCTPAGFGLGGAVLGRSLLAACLVGDERRELTISFSALLIGRLLLCQPQCRWN